MEFRAVERIHTWLALIALVLAFFFNVLIIFVCFWSFNPNNVYQTNIPAEQIIHTRPIMLSSRPIRLPQHVKQPAHTMAPLSEIKTHAQSISTPTPQELSQNQHKILRAGTSLDAPDTTHALGVLDGPGFADGIPQAMPKPVAPTPTPASNIQHHTQPAQRTPKNVKNPGHAELARTHEAQNIIEAPNRPMLTTFVRDGTTHDQGPSEPTLEYTTAQQNQQPLTNLNFLRDDNVYESIREGAINQQRNGRPAGSPAQYGEIKYLHYNQRVYTAMQESMNILMRTMRAAQYRAIMQDICTPTRVRFCLNRNGKLEYAQIAVPSSNPLYDQVALKIIEEASFPSIPSSFNLEKTYFTYGILLYEDDGGHYEIGVSPFLEGD